MRIDVVPAAGLSNSITDRWTEIRASNRSLRSPFFHPEFTKVIARSRADVQLAVLNDGEAFLPFQPGQLGFAKPVGRPLSDYHGLIAAPAANYDMAPVLSACGMQAWSFDHVPADQLSLAPWSISRSESPILELAAAPLNLPKDLSAQLRRKRRKAERELGAIEFEMFSRDPTALERCISWKSAQYAALGATDIFAWPWPRSVLKDIGFNGNRAEFSGALSVLRMGGRPVAVHFGLCSQDILHWWFPAYDPEFGSYSPGLLLLLEIASGARESGISVIDFGRGDMRYKREFANSAIPLIEGSVASHPWILAAHRRRARIMDLARSPAAPWPLKEAVQIARKAYRTLRHR